MAKRDMARYGKAVELWLGWVRFVAVRSGMVWSGVAKCGSCGEARWVLVRLGLARSGLVWQSRLGTAKQGGARCGRSWCGPLKVERRLKHGNGISAER